MVDLNPDCSAARSIHPGQVDGVIELEQLPAHFELETGHVVAVRIRELGHDHYLELGPGGGEYRRLKAGDELLMVAGLRYATSAFESPDRLDQDLSRPFALIDPGGVVGQVRHKNGDVDDPTLVDILGVAGYAPGQFVKTQDRPTIRIGPYVDADPDLTALLVGTSMNSAKSTAAAALCAAGVKAELAVRASKVTGITGRQDPDRMTRAGAFECTDLTDAGYPSTFGVPLEELENNLFFALRSRRPQGLEVRGDTRELWVAELADGILQRETMALLQSERVRSVVNALIFCADSSLSALGGLARLEEIGLYPAALSGIIGSYPSLLAEVQHEIDRTGYMNRWREQTGRDVEVLPHYSTASFRYKDDSDGLRHRDPKAEFVRDPADVDAEQILTAVGLR